MSFINFDPSSAFANRNAFSYPSEPVSNNFTNALPSQPAPSNNSFSMPHPQNMPYGMITPQYSPETTVAITLRHFEKDAKSQAEREYDDENGLLPPPPPEDDLTIDPEVRKAHKKRRKVRSAIVSRRKTAVYLEKLEGELEKRDGMNSTLNKNLALYREVIADIQAKIEAMKRSIDKRSAINNQRARAHQNYPYQAPARQIVKRKRHQGQQVRQMTQTQKAQFSNHFDLINDFQQTHFSRQSNHHQQYQAPSQTTRSYPQTEQLTPPPSASYNQYSSVATQVKTDPTFLAAPQNNICNDIYSSISSEELDDVSGTHHNQASIHQLLGQYEKVQPKVVETDFSECSDRNMSQSTSTNASSFQDESNFQPVQEPVTDSWRPSLHSLPIQQF